MKPCPNKDKTCPVSGSQAPFTMKCFVFCLETTSKEKKGSIFQPRNRSQYAQSLVEACFPKRPNSLWPITIQSLEELHTCHLC